MELNLYYYCIDVTTLMFKKCIKYFYKIMYNYYEFAVRLTSLINNTF